MLFPYILESFHIKKFTMSGNRRGRPKMTWEELIQRDWPNYTSQRTWPFIGHIWGVWFACLTLLRRLGSMFIVVLSPFRSRVPSFRFLCPSELWLVLWWLSFTSLYHLYFFVYFFIYTPIHLFSFFLFSCFFPIIFHLFCICFL